MPRSVVDDYLTTHGLEPGEGVTFDFLANEAYHAGPGLSCTGAKRLLKSPFHYHELAKPHDAPPKAPTPAMLNGTLVHCALLEPDEFDMRYAVSDAEKRSKAWRDICEAWKNAGGLEVITTLQRDAAMRQAHALRTVPAVAELLGAGIAEQSVYWRETAPGLLLKCRPDGRSPVQRGEGVVLLDVKTAADASPDGFAKACASFGYHIQDPWYCEGVAIATGLEVHGMVFGVVESEFPHAAAAYMLSDDARALGREQIAKARATYLHCMHEGVWPGYPQDIAVIDLPRWAYSAAHP